MRHNMGQEFAVRQELQVFAAEPEVHGGHPPGDVGDALLGVWEYAGVTPLVVELHLMHLHIQLLVVSAEQRREEECAARYMIIDHHDCDVPVTARFVSLHRNLQTSV